MLSLLNQKPANAELLCVPSYNSPSTTITSRSEGKGVLGKKPRGRTVGKNSFLTRGAAVWLQIRLYTWAWRLHFGYGKVALRSSHSSSTTGKVAFLKYQ